MALHNDLGKWGEDMAAAFLREEGLVIIDRDWHSGHRDIDIVAIDGLTLVFVEVKTRRNRLYAEPEESIDREKMQYLRLAMNHYVKVRHIDRPVRFDIVTVVGDTFTFPKIKHIKDVPVY